MDPPSSPAARLAPPIKFVAQVAPVKEVTLHGAADLAFWQDKLRDESLSPVPRDGQAQLFLSATEARFLGICFRECLIGMHVSRGGNREDESDSIYLLHAWNSLRAFAWIERNVFGTPYYPGQIAVEPRFPAQLHLSERGQPLIAASMSSSPQEPSQVADEQWQGPIFLPTNKGCPQKLFIAKLEGRTEHFPFQPSVDHFNLFPTAGCRAVGWLIDSHFTPRDWQIRQAAAHAKSKTYQAEQFLASLPKSHK